MDDSMNENFNGNGNDWKKGSDYRECLLSAIVPVYDD